MPHNRIVRAAATQSLPVAQEIVDAVRAAYLAQPGATLISGITLNPLEVLTVDGQSGQSCRMPVTIGDDGGVAFGQPIQPRVPGGTPSLSAPSSSQAPSRGGVSARDEQRIQAAVARGAILPQRVAHFRAQAAEGHDISYVDHLAAGLPPTAGTVTAAAAPGDADADYHALFGRGEPEQDGPEYRSLYGPVAEGQRVADVQAAATRDAASVLTDDQVYEQMFGRASGVAAPVNASAAGRAGQHGRGEASPQRYRVRAPNVTLRVPQDPAGPAASAEAGTSWRVIELRGGDLVPADAHPDDVARLLHQKNRLGPLIKSW